MILAEATIRYAPRAGAFDIAEGAQLVPAGERVVTIRLTEEPGSARWTVTTSDGGRRAARTAEQGWRNWRSSLRHFAG
jgi:hypothetical protein